MSHTKFHTACENSKRARLLAVQIKEEVGMSQHSVDRVAEIIRDALDGKDRTEAPARRLIATLVRTNSEGESYVSRSFTKIDDEAIATIRRCIEEDYDGVLTQKEIDNNYLPAFDKLKRDLADLDKETEFVFGQAGIPVWDYYDGIEDITYRIHLSILS